MLRTIIKCGKCSAESGCVFVGALHVPTLGLRHHCTH
jgi:hypothetical protein